MTRAWKRSALAVLAVAALGLAPSGAAAIADPAHAQPTSSSDTDRAPKFLELAIDSVAPSTVTTTSDPFVVVSATVANVGDRPVTDVSVRMQRAPAVATRAELRTTLRLDQQNFDVVGEFVTVADRLDPGQRKQFTLTMPMRQAVSAAKDTPSLEITRPGVYPLLLNVNGAPEFGDEARLDDARFLLPVLGVPPVPSAPDPTAEDARPIAPSTSSPIALTVLWPLADRPRLAAGVPGSLDQKVRLVDDDLASSLAKGGRLEGLLSSLEFALSSNLDQDHKLADSTCIAVDPDLLITVSNMTRGYLVLTDPADPDGETRDGTGATAATEWLDRLRALASNLCTFALPFAQVDLPAVREAGNAELATSAVTAPADIVDSILAVTTVRDVTWPDSGSIDDATGKWLRALGTETALLAGNAVDATVDNVVAPPDVVRIPATLTEQVAPAEAPNIDDALHAATFDVAAATALAAVGDNPQTPSFALAKGRYDLAGDSRTARLQDALGALTWSSLTPQPETPRSLLLVPPQQWSANADEASAILSEASSLLGSGLATTRKFADLVTRPPDPRPFDLNYNQQTVDDAIPAAIRVPAASQADRIDALADALVDDPQLELTPRRFVAPLREDLLRAMSLSGRRDRDRPVAEAAGHARITECLAALDAMFRSVTILAPGGVYTLASEQSPLLLVARNDLPIGIKVLVRIDAPPVMKITDIGEQQLPPRGSRALTVPTEVNDTRNLFVDVALTTASGQELGAPTTVSVRSNAYGQALAIITACAGALLLVLAGRRLWHRFRGQPDPADEGFER